MDPVLELAAARFAEFLDQLTFLEVPDANDRVAPGAEEVFAVRVENEIGDTIPMDGRELLAFFTGFSILC